MVGAAASSAMKMIGEQRYVQLKLVLAWLSDVLRTRKKGEACIDVGLGRCTHSVKVND